MRAFSPFAFALLLTLAVPLAGANAADITYRNKEYAWSIAYPDDWQLVERTSALVALLPPALMPALVLISSTAASFDTLEAFADKTDVARTAVFARRHLTYTVLGRIHGRLADGTPYIETEYRTADGETLHWRERSFLVHGTGFVLVADTLDYIWVVLDPVFESILDTFRPDGAVALAGAPCAPAGTLCGPPLQWITATDFPRPASAVSLHEAVTTLPK